MTSDYKQLWNLKVELTQVHSNDSEKLNVIKQFADFTKLMLIKGKLDIAQRCFKLAETTFVKGDKHFKEIFSNTFFYCLSLTIAYSHSEHILPGVLKNELYNFESSSAILRKSNLDEL
ncbi:MAG: hypothetical protein JWO58_2517 [Chitinophagaceae bacterium]|nr:hypothetical protein [Chitinophagaceae bacterium]